jgi:hypothetical protein
MLLADLIDADAREVAALPVSVHAALANEYAELQARVKRIGAVLDKGLELAYGKRNSAGTAHQERDGFDLKQVATKKVEWSAEELRELADDAELEEFIEWTPKVPEATYKVLPQRLKDKLVKARTEKVQKTNFEFTKKEV